MTRVSETLLEKMRSACRSKQWPIYLYGDVGRGKSFTTAAVYVLWPGSPLNAMMMRYCDFISNAMRAAKDGSLNGYNSAGVWFEIPESAWWNRLRDAGVLIVDEIGSGTSNDWRNENMWKLLEIRKHRPLIFTGNLTPKEVGEQFDKRIQSRFLEGSFIELRGTDIRRNDLESRIEVVDESRKLRATA